MSIALSFLSTSIAGGFCHNKKARKHRKHGIRGLFLGAVNRIRTGDLVLTKDVLCHLSHNSIYLFLSSDSFYIILNCAPIVNPFFSNFIRKKEDGKSIVKKVVL